MDLPLPRERSQGSWALGQIGTSADIIMVVMMMVIITSILGKWRRELKDGGGRKRICGGDKRGARLQSAVFGGKPGWRQLLDPTIDLSISTRL